jgi:LysM repeat protein
MASLRQNYADLKTTSGSPSVGGSPVDKTKLSSLERQVSESNRKNQSMQREMDELQSTFNSIKGDLRHVIDYVRQDIGEESTGQATKSNQVSSTTVEDPSVAVADAGIPVAPVKEAEAPALTKTEQNTQVASAGRIHKVRPRDTLSGIAQKYKVSQDELQRFNQINDPQDIRMGQTIRIP